MPPRLVAPLLATVLATAALVGCGGSSIENDETRTLTFTSEAPAVPGGGNAPAGAGAARCADRDTHAAALRASGISCEQARRVIGAWRQERGCAVPGNASRAGCLTRSYRCQATRTDRGLAVSCARPGQSVAFVAKP